MLKIAKDLFDLLYPVGTYYETSNANWTPSSAGWYGTWVEDTAGRITVSKSTDTEFNSIGKTGGSKYLQSHYHSVNIYTDYQGNHYHDGIYWGGGTPFTYTGVGGSDGTFDLAGPGIYRQNYNYGGTAHLTTGNAGNHRHLVSGNTGSDGTGNSGNLQPYIVVRRWHRTA